MKRKIALLFMLLSSSTFADPTIFGMAIGKMTEKELKSKYKVSLTGTNKYSKGNMYSIPVSSINFDGLQKVDTIFSQDGKLVAVLTTLPKSKFDYLNNTLNNKYKLVSQQIPFVGNKKATYRQGSTEISLVAPHMSFSMTMSYIDDTLRQTYNRQSQAETHQKHQNEASQL